MTVQAKNERLNKLCTMLKNERSFLASLLSTCDQERVLFRKLNLELLKLIAELKASDVCAQQPELAMFVGRCYAFNYELLKKSCVRFEQKMWSRLCVVLLMFFFKR